MAEFPRLSLASIPKPLLIGAVAILAILAVWLGSGLFSSDEETRMQTAAVTRGTIELTVAASGAMQPLDEVEVGAQVSGQLQTVHVEVGDTVEKGDLLAEIDPTLLEARVESQRASLDGLQANLAQQEAEAVYARQQYQRNQRLFKGNAVSEDTVQSSLAELKVAEAQIESIKADIRQAKATLNEAETDLNYARIYAPMSGTVISQAAVEGQTLNANQTTPTILTIADLTTMTVWAEVSEADVMAIEPGMDVYFTTLGGSGRVWWSTLRQVRPEPEIVNDVVLYNALIDVNNSDRQLLPDMTAQVFFVKGRAENALLIPVSALLKSDDTSAPDGEGTPAKVLVMEGDRPEPREIRIGLKSRTQAEVLSGLSEGDVVALPGLTASGTSSNSGRMRPPGIL